MKAVRTPQSHSLLTFVFRAKYATPGENNQPSPENDALGAPMHKDLSRELAERFHSSEDIQTKSSTSAMSWAASSPGE
jgi:hypothetical protein